MSVNPENTGRIQDGRFRAGLSGNPNGRPIGARNRATRLAEALLDEEAVALMQKAIDLAKAGDITALRLCLERLIPRRVESAIDFEMPQISEPKHAVAALSRITEGIGSGELTATEAHTLVALVEATIKTIEVVDLDQRLTALEEHHAQA
jgi:hypothetical protein